MGYIYIIMFKHTHISDTYYNYNQPDMIYGVKVRGWPAIYGNTDGENNVWPIKQHHWLALVQGKSYAETMGCTN